MKVRPRFWILASVLSLFLLNAYSSAYAADWEPLIRRLVRDGHSTSQVRSLFSNEAVSFDPEPMSHKLHALFETRFKAKLTRNIQEGLSRLGFDPGPVDGMAGWRTQQAILAFQKKYRLPRDGRITDGLDRSIQEVLDPNLRDIPEDEGPPVYKVIMKDERLGEAREFLTRYRDQLKGFEREFGIPQEVAVGILTVETRVGKYLGEKKAFNTLASMSLFMNSSLAEPLFEEEIMTAARRTWLKSNTERVANWAYQELSALLQYVDANQQDPLTLVGSIYGAIGLSQFMPTSALAFGVDGNGDGRVDLFDLDDALHSMANYLRKNGWKNDTQSRRTQARVLYRYNRSRTYVNTVLAVADFLQAEDEQ